MTSKTERFELRLNLETIDRLDRWRSEQADLPSRAESVRRLIEAGLGMTSDQTFQAMKFQILATSLAPQVGKVISDAQVFAWQSGVYPFHDPSQEQWAEPFAAHFRVSKKMIEELAKYLDSIWLKKESITFYELEDHYGLMTSKTDWDRGKLIDACKYMRLQNMFDDAFWNGIVKPMEHPTEAQYIIGKFDRDEDVYLG